jgi:hypothetical protein
MASGNFPRMERPKFWGAQTCTDADTCKDPLKSAKFAIFYREKCDPCTRMATSFGYGTTPGDWRKHVVAIDSETYRRNEDYFTDVFGVAVTYFPTIFRKESCGCWSDVTQNTKDRNDYNRGKFEQCITAGARGEAGEKCTYTPQPNAPTHAPESHGPRYWDDLYAGY